MTNEYHNSASESIEPAKNPNSLNTNISLATLAEMPIWVAWQTQLRNPDDAEPTKIPYDPNTLQKARANDPTTWGTRSKAKHREEQLPKPFGFGGIGVEFCDVGNGLRLAGIDLDDCRDPQSGVIDEWAEHISNQFNSYTEVSPSGEGIKIFYLFRSSDLAAIQDAFGNNAKGEPLTGKTFKIKADHDHPPGIEIYIRGRFFTVTDQRLSASPEYLNVVPVEVIVNLIKVTGPAFAGVKSGASRAASTTDSASGSSTGDKSRSAKAFALAIKKIKEGAGYEDVCVALRTDAETTGWMREKGDANGGREAQRTYEGALDIVEGEKAENTFSALEGLKSAFQNPCTRERNEG